MSGSTIFTDRQTGRQADRQTGRQADRQTGRQADRQTYLDVAKAIGLLAVIVAHIGVPRYLTIALYSFHLPIFFIISGCCFKPECSFKKFLCKKIRGYFIPYCSAAAAIIAFRFIFEGFQLSVLKSDVFLLALQRRYTTLWFLAALFLGILLFWLICKISRDNIHTIVLLSTGISIVFILYDTFIAIPLPWNADTAAIIQFYLAIGYCVKKRKIIDKMLQMKTIRKIETIVICLVLGGTATVLNYVLCGKTYEMFGSRYGIFPLTIFAAVSVSSAVILGSMMLQKCKILSFLGRNTMIYFAFHQSIAMPAASYIMSKMQIIGLNLENMYSVHFLIEFFFVMMVCACGDLIIRYTPLCYLFGKKERSEISKLFLPHHARR